MSLAGRLKGHLLQQLVYIQVSITQVQHADQEGLCVCVCVCACVCVVSPIKAHLKRHFLPGSHSKHAVCRPCPQLDPRPDQMTEASRA